MKVHLPNSAFLGNINSFLKSIDLSNPDVLDITSHKDWISVHPVVLCIVAALGIEVNSKNTPIPVRCERFKAASKHYFERMGLFRFLQLDSEMKITSHESAGRFIPLTQIKTSEDLTQFITDMVPLLHLDPKNAEPIKYIVSEIVRNVLEHSKSKHGAIVCAQYYPHPSNMIRIGIVDTGVGIQKTIQRSHKADTHLDAIRLALTPGITGTTSVEGGTDYNAGAGLFFTKSIAKINRDFFILYSGNTLYKLLRVKDKDIVTLVSDPLDDKHTKDNEVPEWPGTVVGIDITLNQTREFTKLLDSIREIYVRSVRERKAKTYKKPNFI
jgi:anti-sigma regulatory factor (Ser/Thr protein kinase)